MKQALKDLDRVLDAFRDSRARGQKSMSQQVRILAFELARRGAKPDFQVCLQSSCNGHVGGCTSCWVTWAEQKAIEEAMEGEDAEADFDR